MGGAGDILKFFVWICSRYFREVLRGEFSLDGFCVWIVRYFRRGFLRAEFSLEDFCVPIVRCFLRAFLASRRCGVSSAMR